MVGLTGLVALTGCRSSPSVAAYVGEEQISVDSLAAAVDERLADPGIATFAAGDRTAYARQVLSQQVAERVYAAAAERYDVEVSDADVADRIDVLLAGAPPEAVFQQLAEQQGVNAHDVQENIRQQLLRQRAATAADAVDLSDAALRQRYEKSRDTLAQVQLGVITVPDQATADAVLAQLTADPASYPTVAAQYAGSSTLAETQAFTADQLAQLPEVLAAPVTATAPGQGFTQSVPQAGGVVVGFVVGRDVPAFADVRDQLAQKAASEADAAGAELVGDVRDDIRITVNPRYGVLDGDQVVAGTGGVVQLLEDAGNAAAGSSGN
ncbi:peptidyl-prolyl cis-trans isomerase SurA [Modestobacter sp. DSM 44400]|nr:peptidyl-prolyl cis-trans isomerase SurA [Modestobacter sp. DSM 44400]